MHVRAKKKNYRLSGTLFCSNKRKKGKRSRTAVIQAVRLILPQLKRRLHSEVSVKKMEHFQRSGGERSDLLPRDSTDRYPFWEPILKCLITGNHLTFVAVGSIETHIFSVSDFV